MQAALKTLSSADRAAVQQGESDRAAVLTALKYQGESKQGCHTCHMQADLTAHMGSFMRDMMNRATRFVCSFVVDSNSATFKDLHDVFDAVQSGVSRRPKTGWA